MIIEEQPVKCSELFLKCHDASVFEDKNNHPILARVFHDDRNAEQILEHNQFFLIGEKGTGKTMISQYLTHIKTHLNCSILDYSTIDFTTFKKLADEKYLKFIQSDQIWQVLLLTLAAEHVVRKESSILKSVKFKGLYDAISEFYNGRFTPEFPTVIQIVDKIDNVEKLANKYIGEYGDSIGHQSTTTSNTAESPLNTVRLKFFEAFSGARISADHVIFIDKIDIKPDDIIFDDFIMSLRSFVRATLYLNEHVFTKVKGKNRIKFVLLLRPDIFDKLNIQNQSARVSDNSVLLSWDTTYENHRGSAIFALADNFIGRQTETRFAPGAAWDSFIEPNVFFDKDHYADQINRSFREFLRLSWFRPRDIIRSLQICQKQEQCTEVVTRRGFELSFKDFSNYLYGEVKDFSRFYFSDDTFDLIERFFSEIQRLDIITYESFREAHDRFIKKIESSPVKRTIDPRVSDPEEFLQILYSSNIICWRSKNDFGGVDDYWAFRERTATSLEPKVGLYCEYAVHYGLRRALRLSSKHVAAVKDR